MRASRPGVTLMETVLSAMLVGGVLATTLQLVAPTVRSTVHAGNVAIAAGIADAYMEEILAKPYADPESDNGLIGLDDGETAESRKTYDDVDDYHDLVENPSFSDSEHMVPNHTAFKIMVVIAFADPDEPSIDADPPEDTGVKRVTVSVWYHGTLLAQRVGIRTRGHDRIMRN
jgi:MSHA pilin protein MshD